MGSEPEKYISFKREEFYELMGALMLPKDGPVTRRIITEVSAAQLEDAVVLRTKDLFAGTALRAYADTVSNSIEIMLEMGVVVPEHLVRIRDYFYAKSDDAYAVKAKRIPD